MARTRPHGWEIVGVDEATKRTIKLYAAANGLTLPQALAELAKQVAPLLVSPSADRPGHRVTPPEPLQAD